MAHNARDEFRAHLDNDGTYGTLKFSDPAFCPLTLRVPHIAEREPCPVVPVIVPFQCGHLFHWVLRLYIALRQLRLGRFVCILVVVLVALAHLLLFTCIPLALVKFPLILVAPPVHAVYHHVRRTHRPELRHGRVWDLNFRTPLTRSWFPATLPLIVAFAGRAHLV